ncbi:hypothetical protein [Helicobacter pylori]|uniref:hypothetical protein n=1 Tax=Helicobacter pylori TaxID=210 RepID=UPI0021A5027E|nr:hypothetical protein [Helicobacter pylori]
MSGAHIVENTNNEKIEKPNISNPTASTPPNNEELLKSITDFKDRIKKLDDKLEDLKPFIKISRFIGSFFSLGKSSNDTQENSKDAQKKEEALKKFQEENTKLNSKITGLSAEKDKLDKEKTDLTNKNKELTTEKENLTKEKTELTNKNAELQKQVKELEQSQ